MLDLFKRLLPSTKQNAAATDKPVLALPSAVPVRLNSRSRAEALRSAYELDQIHRGLGLVASTQSLYRAGVEPSVDAALYLMRMETRPSTTWWDVVIAFLDRGSLASAELAARFAVQGTVPAIDVRFSKPVIRKRWMPRLLRRGKLAPA